MSAQNSYLSSPRYGYDFVLATTQDSINATMKRYLDGLDQAETHIILKSDDNDKTVLIDFEEFKKGAHGTDPFAVPANADVNGPEIANLDDAGFVAGIKMTLGLPQNFKDPRTLPPIINLKDGATEVEYNMYCANIEVRQLSYGRKGRKKWLAIAQNDIPDKAWMFKSKVNLKLDSADFNKLPENFQKRIKNLEGEGFGVQQLLFDLSNAALQTVPTIDGVEPDSDADMILTKYFINTYFSHMQNQGQPVLNYVVVHKPQEATLKPTNLNFNVSHADKGLRPGLMTLNYLCATDGHKLPPATDFDWNWVTPDDGSQIHGVISLNRLTFANYLMNEMVAVAQKDCFVPKVNLSGLHATAKVGERPPESDIDRQIPTSGDEILRISYVSEEAKDHNLIGEVKLRQTYTKDVTVAGNKVTVVTHQIVWLYVRILLATVKQNVTDKTVTDTYELAVDAHGQLIVNKETNTEDKSRTETTDGWDKLWGAADPFNELGHRLTMGSNVQGEDLEMFRDFIFPGGQTFAFKDFEFSEHQDLLARITYADLS